MSQPQPNQGGSASAPNRPRIFLLPEESAEPQPEPGRLVRRMRLLKYGLSLLSPAACIELQVMAWVLALVCLFEVVVWTFFFNVVVNRDVSYAGWKLPYALLAGCVFGAVVFFFERGMLTSDLAGGWKSKKLWAAALTRLGYIVLTAYVTSIAFELRLFRPSLLERARAEDVRETAAKGWLEVSEYRKLAESIGGKGSVAFQKVQAANEQQKRLQDADKALEASRKERDQWAAAIAGAEVRKAALQQELRVSDGDSGALLHRIAQLDLAVARYRVSENSASQKFDDILHKRDLIDVDVKTSSVNLENERTRVAQHAEKRAQEFRQWTVDLGKLEPDQELAFAGWKIGEAQPDFLKQLRILGDLEAGRPPLWRGGSEESRRSLENDYGFKDLICKEASPESSACREIEAQKDAVQRTKRLGLVLAFLIPSLVVATKLFMLPDELRMYYSRAYQARAGERGAKLLTHIDEQLRAESPAPTGGV